MEARHSRSSPWLQGTEFGRRTSEETMSRIHEALKKAAQERGTQLDPTLEAGVGEIAVEIPRPVITGPNIAPLPGPGRATVGSGQNVLAKYEELVRRCAQPEWRLDPFSSFFPSSETRRGGSERCPTFRSRLYQTASTRTLPRGVVTNNNFWGGKKLCASCTARSTSPHARPRDS